MANIMYWEAIQRAHDEEMARDPLVICMGEDIGVAGGTYKATKGLYEKYGPLRVMDTPKSCRSTSPGWRWTRCSTPRPRSATCRAAS
jgi:pyruvate/2-oxoglutarate/acetoin dehydrogenase E1 component